MAWQRIERRLEAGEDPFTLLHGTQNPVEVEAIASIGPSELARSSGRSADAWRAELRDAAAQVYPALTPDTFGPVTKAVEDTAPQLAYADAPTRCWRASAEAPWRTRPQRAEPPRRPGAVRPAAGQPVAAAVHLADLHPSPSTHASETPRCVPTRTFSELSVLGAEHTRWS